MREISNAVGAVAEAAGRLLRKNLSEQQIPRAGVLSSQHTKTPGSESGPGLPEHPVVTKNDPPHGDASTITPNAAASETAGQNLQQNPQNTPAPTQQLSAQAELTMSGPAPRPALPGQS